MTGLLNLMPPFKTTTGIMRCLVLVTALEGPVTIQQSYSSCFRTGWRTALNLQAPAFRVMLSMEKYMIGSSVPIRRKLSWRNATIQRVLIVGHALESVDSLCALRRGFRDVLTSCSVVECVSQVCSRSMKKASSDHSTRQEDEQVIKSHGSCTVIQKCYESNTSD